MAEHEHDHDAGDRTHCGQQRAAGGAGRTYEGFKINQDMEVQTRAIGMKMPGTRMQTVEWFVPGTGWIKSETYRNGKLMTYSVLNKINK
ncbi:hypothetical protein [Pontibacter sp. BAB1700]|uniref:TapB family protein n=1 Tax=Pontibacter sp. BAB1700 TaxID=1144253 RepID=UPI00026BD554|nr:hypothetical protein [Pontibacter sp. BAB1700]EJF11837.1 hypothetical protein O71_00757 [Pontibacter sp. BAB1700]